MSTEPIVIDTSDPAFLANPYPLFRRLRNEAPVHWWDRGHMWMLSRHADVEATLKDPRFTVDNRKWRFHRGNDQLPRELIDQAENGLFQLGSTDHARVRRLVSPSFTPRAAAKRELLVQEIVDELLAKIDPQSFDLVADFAEHLPFLVIGRILGISAEHEHEFREWGHALIQVTFPLLPPDEHLAMARSTVPGFGLLERVIEERRRSPGDDMLSSLIQAEEEGERLSSAELVSLVGGLVTAGSETTVHLLAFAVLELLRHPETLARVREDLGLLPGVIEEVLRHDNFGGLGVARFALEEVEIRGQTIAKGDMVMLLLGAAMHDEDVWPDAERFDIDREPAPNLSFGRGPHFCLGANLARAEARVALQTLLTRYPDMQLTGEPVFRPHPLLRQMVSLPLRLQ
ncbi:cytochrome P450 [Paraliomyxa miuraensis]|uniref:cytochrome P450 n=1 Tax=Paraliomyxa miuraensis TaxID=376150 RepID=UPI002258BFD0|nr:cytochrome P450 [Paraliomyxa miuraensis]MCX4246985.1 cytochrome P450 [Paraliomyxa miuraensis]